MKQVSFLLIAFAALLGCKKNEPVMPLPVGEKELWVRFDAEEQPFKTKVIHNPQPTRFFELYQNGEGIGYDLYFANEIYPNLQVNIIKRKSGSIQTGIDSIYTIGINVQEAIVRKQSDGYFVTAKYLRTGNTYNDSIYALTFESEINFPFSDTVVYEEVNWNDSRFFNVEDDINVLDTAYSWDDRADRNGITVSIISSDFYLYRDGYTEEYNTGQHGSYFELRHDYHNGIKGESNKIFVFRWRNNNSATGYYYGWMELSLTENREFTIHKVVYQID